MTLGVVILCVVGAALVSFGVSAVVAVGLALGGRALESRAPSARARVALVLAVLPALATVAVMLAALAPSFGWTADHCAGGVEPHGHPHICGHFAPPVPAAPLVALAALFALRTVAIAAHAGALGWAAARARRALIGRAEAFAHGAHVLPSDEPHAFVLGVVRPALFVSRGLLAPAHCAHADAVLAHERAHLLRADPLRRLIARLASGFHLPVVAGAIERRLARSHELAADELAADRIGSRARVARAVVHLARARARTPRTALAFAGADLEVRIRALLAPRATASGPAASALVVAAAAGAIGAAIGANAIHHGIEVVLGLVGG